MFCKKCRHPAGDPLIHASTEHKGEDPSTLFELEFDHVLPINGSGHTEKILMQATTQVLFKLIGLNQFASWCDFLSDKAKHYLFSFGDHHKGWDFLWTILQTVSREISFEFVKVLKLQKGRCHKYKDLLKWFTDNKEIRNINLLRMLPVVNGPLLSAYFFMCVIHCANQRASLSTFINNNQNYQVISSFELYLIKCAPREVKEFLYRVSFQRIKKHESWDSCSEGLAYRLEEKNRSFKQNHHKG